MEGKYDRRSKFYKWVDSAEGNFKSLRPELLDMGDEWFEDQEFWDSFSKHMFSEGRVSRGEEQVGKITALLDLNGGEKILDLPCGVGRHATSLAERGYDVTGVDISNSYIEKARERADNENLDFYQGDMKEYTGESKFDLILNLWNSFGYFEDDEDNQAVLDNFSKNLGQEGVLLMQLNTKETFSNRENFNSRHWEEQDGAFFLQKREITDNWKWHTMEWKKVMDGEIETHTVKTRIYSGERIVEMLEKAGFNSIEMYGDLDGSDYDENAERAVILAKI